MASDNAIIADANSGKTRIIPTVDIRSKMIPWLL